MNRGPKPKVPRKWWVFVARSPGREAPLYAPAGGPIGELVAFTSFAKALGYAVTEATWFLGFRLVRRSRAEIESMVLPADPAVREAALKSLDRPG